MATLAPLRIKIPVKKSVEPIQSPPILSAPPPTVTPVRSPKQLILLKIPEKITHFSEKSVLQCG